MKSRDNSKVSGGGKILRRLAIWGGLMLSAGVMSAQKADIAFHYTFPSESPETDSGPLQRTLTFGQQVEFVAGAEGKELGGIKLYPSLEGRAFFEDPATAEASVLHQLLNSPWTLEFWVKLEEFGERNQMLFSVQPVGSSFSDLGIRIQPEKDAEGAGSLVLTDSTTAARAKSAPLDWKTNTWYYVAIVAVPSESGTDYTFYRGEKEAGDLSEVYSGHSIPLLPLNSENPRVFQFANFWGNFGKDALRGILGSVQLTWKEEGEAEINKKYRQEHKQ